MLRLTTLASGIYERYLAITTGDDSGKISHVLSGSLLYGRMELERREAGMVTFYLVLCSILCGSAVGI